MRNEGRRKKEGKNALIVLSTTIWGLYRLQRKGGSAMPSISRLC